MNESLRRSAFVLAPCFVGALLAAPLVVHGLPDYESHLGEEYQPLKTLKFFHSRGREFHKWGPADDFLYAPGYGLSLAYWKLKGTFGPTSNAFPYGFQQPLQQLTVLILQSRVLLLCLVLGSLAALGLSLLRAGFSRVAAFFALFLCTATNPVLIWHSVVLKGDGPMIAFSSLALGAYLLILRRGVTTARAFWFSTFIAWAVTAKELAVPLFALPCVGLALEGFRGSHPPELRAQWRHRLAVGLAALVGWYLLLNVVYAPATWLKRIRFWLVGPGMDPEIWGAPNRSMLDYVLEMVRSLTDNLGPGGILTALASIGVLLWLRPPGSWRLALPLASFILFGLLPAGYLPDHFAMPTAIALVPLVACAIDSARKWGRRELVIPLALVAAANLLYANIVWLQLRSSPDDLIEAYVRARLANSDRFSIFSLWPRIPGKSRLEAEGYHLDSRPIGELVSDRQDLPRTLFITDEGLRWIKDFTLRPKRAAVFKRETGFDVQDWESFTALGYRLVDRLSSPLPAWYPFGWLPMPAYSAKRAVLVYRLE